MHYISFTGITGLDSVDRQGVVLFRMVAKYRWVDIIGTSFMLEKGFS